MNTTHQPDQRNGRRNMRALLADCHSPNNDDIADHLWVRLLADLPPGLADEHPDTFDTLYAAVRDSVRVSSSPSNSAHNPLVTPPTDYNPKSKRLLAGVAAYNSLRAVRYNVAPGESKFFEDLTVDDARKIIVRNLGRIDALQYSNKTLERLADECVRRNVDRFGDLPQEVVLELTSARS